MACDIRELTLCIAANQNESWHTHSYIQTDLRNRNDACNYAAIARICKHTDRFISSYVYEYKLASYNGLHN